MNRFTTSIIFTVFCALGGMAQAADNPAPKIAVLDMARALFESEIAKEVDTQFGQQTANDQEKVRELATEAQALQQQLQQDGEAMSDAQKQELASEIESIGVQYQYLVQKLQQQQQQLQQQFQQAYAPNLIQAIQAVVEEDGYDLVLRAEAALHFRTAYDITAKVTARLNQQAQAQQPQQ